ncbi:MAG: hypothetical protein ACRD4K_12620 [Candidatus Acidiferrales bacterium]
MGILNPGSGGLFRSGLFAALTPVLARRRAAARGGWRVKETVVVHAYQLLLRILLIARKFNY